MMNGASEFIKKISRGKDFIVKAVNTDGYTVTDVNNIYCKIDGCVSAALKNALKNSGQNIDDVAIFVAEALNNVYADIKNAHSYAPDDEFIYYPNGKAGDYSVVRLEDYFKNHLYGFVYPIVTEAKKSVNGMPSVIAATCKNLEVFANKNPIYENIIALYSTIDKDKSQDATDVDGAIQYINELNDSTLRDKLLYLKNNITCIESYTVPEIISTIKQAYQLAPDSYLALKYRAFYLLKLSFSDREISVLDILDAAHQSDKNCPEGLKSFNKEQLVQGGLDMAMYHLKYNRSQNLSLLLNGLTNSNFFYINEIYNKLLEGLYDIICNPPYGTPSLYYGYETICGALSDFYVERIGNVGEPFNCDTDEEYLAEEKFYKLIEKCMKLSPAFEEWVLNTLSDNFTEYGDKISKLMKDNWNKKGYLISDTDINAIKNNLYARSDGDDEADEADDDDNNDYDDDDDDDVEYTPPTTPSRKNQERVNHTTSSAPVTKKATNDNKYNYKLETYKTIGKAAANKMLAYSVLFFGLLIVGIVTMIIGHDFKTYLLIGLAEIAIGLVVFIGNLIISAKFGSQLYLDSHCQFCGSSYEGCDYGYKEISRKLVNANSSSPSISCKFNITITCADCGRTWNKVEQISGYSVDDCEDKLVDRLNKLTGPEIEPKKRMMNPSGPMIYSLWLSVVVFIVLAICVSVDYVGQINAGDTKDYYGRYVYGSNYIEIYDDYTLKTDIGGYDRTENYYFYTAKNAEELIGEYTSYDSLIVFRENNQYEQFSIHIKYDSIEIIYGTGSSNKSYTFIQEESYVEGPASLEESLNNEEVYNESSNGGSDTLTGMKIKFNNEHYCFQSVGIESYNYFDVVNSEIEETVYRLERSYFYFCYEYALFEDFYRDCVFIDNYYFSDGKLFFNDSEYAELNGDLLTFVENVKGVNVYYIFQKNDDFSQYLS